MSCGGGHYVCPQPCISCNVSHFCSRCSSRTLCLDVKPNSIFSLVLPCLDVPLQLCPCYDIPQFSTSHDIPKELEILLRVTSSLSMYNHEQHQDAYKLPPDDPSQTRTSSYPQFLYH